MKLTDSQNITARIFRRSGLLSLVRLLQIGVTFSIFWLFSIYLSKESYGVYQKIFVLTSFFSGLCCLGLPVLIASLPPVGSGKVIVDILKKFRLIYALTIIGSAIFIICFAGFISYTTRLVSFLLILSNATYLLAEVYLVKLHRDNYILLNNLLYAPLYFGVHVFVIKQPAFSFPLLMNCLLLLSFIRLLMMFISNWRFIKNDMATAAEVGTSIYINQWKFLSVNEMLDLFSRQIDKLFLLWLLSAAVFAVYFNGSYEIPLIGVLITTTGTFMTMQTVQTKDGTVVKKMLHKSSLMLSAILFPLFFFLFINAEGLFQLLFKGRYNDSVPVFLISCCIIPLRIINYTAILQGYHKGKEILIGSGLGLCIKIILSIAFYFFLDVRGVALAFILGTFVQMAYYLFQTSKLLDENFTSLLPYLNIALLFIATGVIVFSLNLLIKNNAALVILISSAIACALITIFGILYFLKKGKSKQ